MVQAQFLHLGGHVCRVDRMSSLQLFSSLEKACYPVTVVLTSPVCRICLVTSQEGWCRAGLVRGRRGPERLQ